MSEELLPLFPLQVVLFPNSALPLHIFEERYKLLINESMAERKEFGINLLTGEKVSDVGCTAVVRSVTRRYDDGRMDIVVEGKRQYVLRRYDRTSTPYLVGYVEYFRNGGEEFDQDLARDTVTLYNTLLELVYGSAQEQIPLDVEMDRISFRLAQKAGMDLHHRQRLLEMASENERLRMLHRYLAEIIPKLKQFEEISRVIRGDGYI